MAIPLKIEKLEEKWQKKVLDLKGMGWGNQQISEYLNKEVDTDLLFNSGDVFNFLNKNSDRAIKVMKSKGNFEKKMSERYFDTIEQLTSLNKEMIETFYNLKTNPEYKEKRFNCEKCGKTNIVQLENLAVLIKTEDHVLKQIQHVDNILGKVSKKSFQISYNITEISDKIGEAFPNVIDRMEKEGRIDAIQRLIKKKKRQQKREEEDLYN